jgi:hypothetical protein
VIGHDRNATTRVPGPEEFDLFDSGGKIIAGMDNDKQRLLLLEFAREQIIGARYRRQDMKIC